MEAYVDLETRKTLPNEWLRRELIERRERNSHYSLRSFAAHLEMPAGRLSELLAGKRRVTPKMGARIAESLAYPPATRAKFLSVIADAAAARRGVMPERPVAGGKTEQARKTLEDDTFHLIADWYHFALLSLAETETFRADPKWIARRLGLSVVEVRSAVERLRRLGALLDDGAGGLKVAAAFETTSDIPSAALRRSHRQTLEQAALALEDVRLELRDVTSITMAIDPAKIPEAKKAIKRFRRDLCALLEDGRRTEVYNLNVQLVPVTRWKEKSRE